MQSRDFGKGETSRSSAFTAAVRGFDAAETAAEITLLSQAVATAPTVRAGPCRAYSDFRLALGGLAFLRPALRHAVILCLRREQ